MGASGRPSVIFESAPFPAGPILLSGSVIRRTALEEQRGEPEAPVLIQRTSCVYDAADVFLELVGHVVLARSEGRGVIWAVMPLERGEAVARGESGVGQSKELPSSGNRLRE
jgi:hypothetical protein